jgi:hypothetical protein
MGLTKVTLALDGDWDGDERYAPRPGPGMSAGGIPVKSPEIGAAKFSWYRDDCIGGMPKGTYCLVLARAV